MSSGTPLTDADRIPWLQRIAQRIDAWRSNGEAGVVTCSALKRAYRDIIVGDRPDVGLVHLRGSRELIGRRMAARKGHFMPTALLDNQFATLQEPSPEERAIVVDVGGAPAEIVDEILRRLPPKLKLEPA
jgi:carbohydrate kinase (thermoresistant glucokinase family)